MGKKQGKKSAPKAKLKVTINETQPGFEYYSESLKRNVTIIGEVGKEHIVVYEDNGVEKQANVKPNDLTKKKK